MTSLLFPSLHGVRREWLNRDLVAAFTVWAVLVPEALAYATIAGVSPVVGLYAAIPALVLYAAFGSSRHLVVGPMSATAALSATAVADVTTGGDDVAAFTAALALMIGVAALVAGLLRLGFVSNFISEPVLKGFIIGIALTIIVGQLPKLVGVSGGEGEFFEKLWDFLTKLDDVSGATVAVGLTSLVMVLALKRYLPALPASLVVVVLAVIAVKLFDLDEHGVAIVGSIKSGLPSLGFPDVGIDEYGLLAGPAIGVMFVGFAEGLGAAKTYAARDHYEIDANRELIGLGAANLGAGVSSGMVVNGSLSKTAVNAGAGARSQVSGLVVAALTIVTLLLLTGLFEDLPEATLAAVVIAAVIELVDVRALMALWRLSTTELAQIYGVAARPDLIAALAALLGVLVFDTLPGLAIGVLVSLLLLIYRASRPHLAVMGHTPASESFVDLTRDASATPVPGLVVLRPETSLFFVNAEAIRAGVLAHVDRADVTAIVLDAETIPSIDITAARMLVGLADDLQRRGVRLVVARDVGQVRDLIARAGLEPTIHTYPTVRAAVAALTDAAPPSEP
jgi:high affinity sulfate transporter 1